MTLIERAERLKARVLARLRSSGDREYEMLGNRLVIATIVGVYSLLALPGALLLVADPLLKPGASEMRRLACEPALNQSRISKAYCPEVAEQG